MPREYSTLLDLIGQTPIVRLQKIGAELGCTLLAKLEYLNPGGSNKDRIGLRVVETAEREGKLRPGGTIVEPTSGNTGVGLALAAAIKGYRMIMVLPDKVAPEKISLLRAFGAEPDPGVISVGTGGSITGAGRYLKEQNPELLIVGADPEGSIYSGTDVHPYLVEGIGKDTFPATFDPSVVDEYVRVSDRDSFLVTRRLAREEGILAGGSGGTSVHALLETARKHGPGITVLTTIPDGRRGYLSKIFDDNWMLEHGFLERRGPAPTIAEVLAYKHSPDGGLPALVVCGTHEKLGAASELMQRYGISQLPVVRHEPVESLADVIGSLNERGLLDRVFKHPDSLGEDVASAMGPPLPAADANDSVDEVFADRTGGGAAVVVVYAGKPTAVLTRSDLLEYLAHGRTDATG